MVPTLKLGRGDRVLLVGQREHIVSAGNFLGTETGETLNPYARIIIREAQRRGIYVEVLDAEGAYFELSFGGRSVVCRESLSELTSAIAMSRCDDKALTHRVLKKAGLMVPAQSRIKTDEDALEFLERSRL